jgi:hypothetical protein
MCEDDLVSAASGHEVLVRVITRDGKSLPSRADRRPNRINVDINDGLVTRVDGAG